jgi:hypothetical protein
MGVVTADAYAQIASAPETVGLQGSGESDTERSRTFSLASEPESPPEVSPVSGPPLLGLSRAGDIVQAKTAQTKAVEMRFID